jgi:hypothetical protein
MMKNVAKEMGEEDPFIGHLGESDFVLIGNPNKIDGLKDRVATRLEQAIDYFYPLRDREQSSDERPRISLTISVVRPDDGPFDSPLALKKVALQKQMTV